MFYFFFELSLTLPPPAPTMQPESFDGFASVGTILPEERAALLPGGSFRFWASFWISFLSKRPPADICEHGAKDDQDCHDHGGYDACPEADAAEGDEKGALLAIKGEACLVGENCMDCNRDQDSTRPYDRDSESEFKSLWHPTQPSAPMMQKTRSVLKLQINFTFGWSNDTIC